MWFLADLSHWRAQLIVGVFLIMLCAVGCNVLDALPAQSARVPLSDASGVMQGICFEAALALSDEVFTVRNTLDLIRLYDRIDQMQLCRRPMQRETFDFGAGRALVGVWSAGVGCTARHDVLSAARDVQAMLIDVQLRFVTEGACNYELVRPYWVAVPDAAGFTIEVSVE
jgi:hypothetical protein